MLGVILFYTFLASVLSLLLVAILLLHKSLIHRLSFFLVSFAAGALLATGFLDTMKEAVEIAGEEVFLWVTLSMAVFFLIERFFLSLHHHEHEDHDEKTIRMPTSFLIFGDALHNFIDGASIAASFLVSFPLGLITSITVFVHEIPHELGDFGILLNKGWGRRKVLLFNFLTGLTAVAGAILAYYLGSQFSKVVPILLAITTGNFIYLSATDLLPEIHHRAKAKHILGHATFFLLGITLVLILTKIIV